MIRGLEGRVPTPSEGELPAKRDMPLAIRWRQISATSLAARSAALEGILQLGASGRVWHVPGCEVIQIQIQFWPSSELRGTSRLTHVGLAYMHGLIPFSLQQSC